MIITCPHCQTKYQVTYEAIGSVGRKVQCAYCRQAWQQPPIATDGATPENQAAADTMDEDALDDAMEAEARRVAEETREQAPVPEPAEDSEREVAAKVDPALINKRQKAFTRRQTAIAAELPLARLRRSLRVIGLVLLAGVLATAYFGRVAVVARFPAMAGVYQALGLGVNVVGLEFTDVSTLRTLRDGKDILLVSAQIVGLEPQPMPVPPVVVTLIDAHGQPIYQWSVAPAVRDLLAGERSSFDTQLTLPPGDAARVRLSFDGGQAQPASPDAPPPAAAAAEPNSHPSPEHH